MSDRPEKPFSFAMRSALQAVTRMKSDSSIAWLALRDERDHDDRTAPAVEPDPRQGSKPAER